MNVEALMKSLNIDKEHKIKIEEVTKYMDEHRVQELFNVKSHSINGVNRKYWQTFYTRVLLTHEPI